MNKYLSNAIWMLIEKLLRVVTTLVFLGLIARSVGPSEFGVLNLCISLLAFLWVITNFGLDNILLKEFSSDNNDTAIFSTISIIRIFFSLILSIISILIIYIYSGFDLQNNLFLIFSVLVTSLPFYNYYTYQAYYQAKSQSRYTTKISIISILLSSLIKVFLFIYDAGILAFTFSLSLDVIIYGVFLAIFNKNTQLYVNIKNFDYKIVKYLFKQSLPLFLSSIIIVLYIRIDQFVIAFYLSTYDVGLYTAAIRLAEAYGFLPALIATSFYPMLVKKYNTDNIQMYFDIIFFTAALAAIAVLILSPFIVPWLFGSEYIVCIQYLRVLIISTLFSVMGIACTNCLVIENLGYFRLIRIIGGLVINIILNILLVPRIGLWGAVIASLLSQIFASWLGNLFSKRTIKYVKFQAKAIITLGIPGVVSLFISSKE